MGPGPVFSKHMWLQSLDPAESAGLLSVAERLTVCALGPQSPLAA